MLCEYFRYIDLEQVYEQLEDFTYYTGPELANIPWQFGETLSSCFEDMADAVFEQYGNDAWRELPAIQVAAEIGDHIESDLEKIAAIAEISLPTRRASAKTLIEKMTVLAVHASFRSFDYWQTSSLLLYQYDLLCWLYSKEKISEAFQVYELILRTFGELSASFALNVTSESQSRAVSDVARERAKKRHAHTNKIKSDLLSEWDTHFAEYNSRADFSRIVSQRDGLLYRTVYDWIASHDRSKI
ncbi:hypothetical protein [Pseudomonas lactucae]|uniref:Uncharacterized protein n=1 Tax=Pseudomonas lactucae TaxID=2813360 RepID=A0A9X0Y6K3_9PSED|nr:hypothetical protein [Pseudomonas lactucae]MBN2974703.1 hypothetical protein [Pseudomonas lactucae]MBN2987311.1 hypothetical protein [Pseudomonas lactucae]